jgi:hypothetical protein
LQDKSGSGDDDLLSLASELEMDLQQHPEESPSKLAEDDDTAGSLFSDDEEDAEHGHRPVNHPTSTGILDHLALSPSLCHVLQATA